MTHRPIDTAPQPGSAPWSPPATDRAGQAVGAYVLQHQIGHGGMGSVWLARRADGRYDGRVAIKFMHAGLAASGATDRFVREGQLLARLDHPHIARLLDAGVLRGDSLAPGQPYLVLEYVEGQPIDVHCDAQGLDITDRVRLMVRVLDAVAHAHSRLILHRDLKPPNILVTADGSPKLLDFGVGKLLADAQALAPDGGLAGGASAADAAELTQFTRLAFTTRYAAPEQVQQQDVTTATDVYALGVLLYGLLGGGHPTEPPDSTPLEQWRAVVDRVPPRLSDALGSHGPARLARAARTLRGDMDTIVARALKKDPAERYANAAALADDLRRWLAHEPVLARRDGTGYRISRFARRHAQVLVAAGTAGTLVLAGGATLALWQAHQARTERSHAEALVEFMLGDLQHKLSQLGRTDVLQAVGEKALAYYADDRPDRMDSEALARRARALQVIGESARQRLDLAQARRAFEQAADTTARLLALAPDNIQRLQGHASSLERMVTLADRNLDDDQALALSWQISALRWRASELAPQDHALRLQALMGDQWPAAYLVTQGPASEGLALLARVQQGLQTLPPHLEGLQRAKIITLGQKGQALMTLGRFAEAAETFRGLSELLPAQHNAEPDVRERRENLIFLRGLVHALLYQGLLKPAIDLTLEIVARSESDSGQSTDNLILAEWAVAQRAFLGRLLLHSGDRAEARAQLQLINDRLVRMGTVAANNTEWHVKTLGEVLALRARLQLSAQTPQPPDPGLLAALQQHADHVDRLQAQGPQPEGSDLLAVLAVLDVGLAHGDTLLAQGQGDAARQRWQRVADTALPVAHKGAHPVMQRLAQALLRLGQPQQARPWVERLQAVNWRHPEMAEVQQQLARADGAQRTALSR